MRFYTRQHRHYCGIDLHARSMYVCVVDEQRNVLLHKNLPTDGEVLLGHLAPYGEDLVIAVECIFNWYWLADLCAREGIAFVLGHALFMKAVHGAKAKSDRIDSQKIALLLAGQVLPQAYVYPAAMRATRDLLRRRLHFVRHRGQLRAHIQLTHHQYNRPAPGKSIAYASNRKHLGEGWTDVSIRKSVEADVALMDNYDGVIDDIELAALKCARGHDPQALARLQSIPGIGKILAMTILYEIGDIARFPTVQQFSSYARLVKCEHSSAGKTLGTGGSKMGNAFLKWAFSEAAVTFLSKGPVEGKHLLARLERKHGKGKALSILAHRLGRAVWHMLSRKQAFDADRFLKSAF